MAVRAFVTGSTGFLGRHLVRSLVNEFVVQLVRDKLPFNDEELSRTISVNSDLSSIAFIERILAEYEIDTVFHLAAQTQVSTAVHDPVGTLETNVRGTWNVLEACHRQKVKRVVFASSDKCYGNGPSPYIETQALLPHGIYATSKACADFVAQSYALEFGMSIAISRCGNLYGPGHTNWSTLIPGTIRSVLLGERPVLRSNGKARRDYLFVEDAVDAYLALANSIETGIWNFGNGIPYTAIDVTKTILRIMESDLTVDIRDISKDEIEAQYLNASKAKRIGWSPKFNLDSGLAKTIPWYREHLR